MELHTYDADTARAPGPAVKPGEVHWAAPGAHPPDDAETFSARPYSAEFEEHPDLAATWGLDPAFLDAFGAGVTAYRRGEWGEACAALERVADARLDAAGRPVRDGPATALLTYMKAQGGSAPRNWRGFRELTEK